MSEEHWARKQYLLRKSALRKYAELLVEARKKAVQVGEIVETHSTSDLPRQPGIYFLYDDDKLIYIGQSRNLRRRLSSHHVYKQGHTIEYWPMEVKLLRPTEWALIAIYKPPKQRPRYLDTNFLNYFDIEEVTGIKYRTLSLIMPTMEDVASI